MTVDNQAPIAIDIFAGGGALTLGLKSAGYAVAAAVEICPHAADTYRANHPDVKLLEQDIRMVSGSQLKAIVRQKQVALLAGCPPCQGFTSLTAKYKRFDPRNSLIREMLRLIEELEPQVVMMENVPGLAGRGAMLLDEFCNRLGRMDYKVNCCVLNAADFGVPQHRRRLVVLADRERSISMPRPTHSREGVSGLSKWRTVRDAISYVGDPITLAEMRERSGLDRGDWNIVRSLSEINRARLRYARPGKTWLDIPETLRPACHRGNYRGFVNVYGRMEWDDVAPTITGGCTTLSKGRFGHPEKDRTISVREAALLQTIPYGYIIATPYIDHACSIVGNALPCKFAKSVAQQCLRSIKFGGELISGD